MTNQDQKYETLTDKSRSHKKAKFMNSERQTDRQDDRQTYRLTGRQTALQTDRKTEKKTVKKTMTNQDSVTLTDKSKTHQRAKFLNSDIQTDRQVEQQTKLYFFLKDILPQWDFTLGVFQPNARSWTKKYPNLPKIICWLTRLVVIQTDQATDRVN